MEDDLLSLRERRGIVQQTSNTRPVKEGKVVKLKEEGTAKCLWPLAWVMTRSTQLPSLLVVHLREKRTIPKLIRRLYHRFMESASFHNYIYGRQCTLVTDHRLLYLVLRMEFLHWQQVDCSVGPCICHHMITRLSSDLPRLIQMQMVSL